MAHLPQVPWAWSLGLDIQDQPPVLGASHL